MRYYNEWSKEFKLILLSAFVVMVLLLAIIGVIIINGDKKSNRIIKTSSESFYISKDEEKANQKTVITIELPDDEEDIIKNNEEVNQEANQEVNYETNQEVNKQNESEDEYATGATTYYIKVNIEANTVTVYEKDDEGYYSIPVKAMICSTGGSTPQTGVYKIPGRKTVWRALYGNVYGQYATNIVGAILFHSVPYLLTDPSTLEYWEYDQLGTSASMGCVRLTVADAKWIYDNIAAGTMVEFYSDTNPGPLGKPSAQKISQNEECRNWDPTDTADGNPWTNYIEDNSTIESYNDDVNETFIEEN